MEKKYISSNRYKKIVRDKNRKRGNNNLNKKKSDEKNIQFMNKKKLGKKKTKLLKRIFLICLIISLIVILVVLRFKLKAPNESFFDIFGLKIEDENIEKINIGLIDNIDIQDENTKNVILTELNLYTGGALLKIDSNYNINYDLLSRVDKVSNSEYILNISKENGLTATVLIARISSFNVTYSKYYSNVKNISSMEVIDEKTLKVVLDKDMPLFIYNLQLPIYNINGGMYSKNTIKNTQDLITYISKKNANIPKTINVYKVENDEKAVENFKNDKINLFITNNFHIGDLLGKYEYDIHSYKTGEVLMLFGNKNSKLFSKKEIRQAIVYSIDRDKIKREIYFNSGAIIDIPFIYSNVKYKYDIYSASNILLTNGYNLNSGIFQKTENGEMIKLNLKLIVNKQDETKIKVASYIKQDLKSVGINVDIVTLNESNLNKAITNRRI